MGAAPTPSCCSGGESSPGAMGPSTTPRAASGSRMLSAGLSWTVTTSSNLRYHCQHGSQMTRSARGSNLSPAWARTGGDSSSVDAGPERRATACQLPRGSTQPALSPCQLTARLLWALPGCWKACRTSRWVIACLVICPGQSSQDYCRRYGCACLQQCWLWTGMHKMHGAQSMLIQSPLSDCPTIAAADGNTNDDSASRTLHGDSCHGGDQRLQ